MWERVHALRAEHGTTIVVTTHLMEEAERHCDRVAIMDAGRVVELGTPGELLARHGGAVSEDVFRAVTGRGMDGEGRYAMSAPSAASPAGSAERARRGPPRLRPGRCDGSPPARPRCR